MCQVKVSHKWVRWKMWQISIVSVPQHTCRHSGSWASSCFEYNGLSQRKQALLLQCYRNDITKFIGNTFQSHFKSFQVLLTSRSGSFDVHFKFDLFICVLFRV